MRERARLAGIPYVDWVDIAILRIAVHMAVGEQAIGKQRQENKLRKSKQLVS